MLNILCAHGFHKFSPRYSKSASKINVNQLAYISIFDTKESVEGFRDIEYKGDICVRCGKVIVVENKNA